MNDTKAILIKAKQILKNPNRWAKGFGFRDKQGNPCDSEHAYSYCLYGATTKAAKKLGVDLWDRTDANNILSDLAKKKYGKLGSIYNDHPQTTHEDIMNLLQEAIDAA